MKNRMGKFYLPLGLVKGDPDIVALVLALMSFVPVQVNYLAMTNEMFEYIGFSKMFEEIEENTRPPQYEIAIDENKETGMVENVRAVRCEK